MTGAWWAWPVALVLYGAFRLWYDNRRGPLTPAEIEAFLAQAAERAPTGGHTDLAVLRAFLEADDGREFVMSNLLRLHTQAVPHPVTGVPTPAPVLLNHYVRRFIPLLLRHGGHPVLAMRKVGGYVDAWNTPADPGWHCGQCGTPQAAWHPVCPACHAPARMVWGVAEQRRQFVQDGDLMRCQGTSVQQIVQGLRAADQAPQPLVVLRLPHGQRHLC